VGKKAPRFVHRVFCREPVRKYNRRVPRPAPRVPPTKGKKILREKKVHMERGPDVEGIRTKKEAKKNGKKSTKGKGVFFSPLNTENKLQSSSCDRGKPGHPPPPPCGEGPGEETPSVKKRKERFFPKFPPPPPPQKLPLAPLKRKPPMGKNHTPAKFWNPKQTPRRKAPTGVGGNTAAKKPPPTGREAHRFPQQPPPPPPQGRQKRKKVGAKAKTVHTRPPFKRTHPEPARRLRRFNSNLRS